MIDLPNITLIAVSSVQIEQTIKALEYSCRGINFGAVKFVTHEEIDHEYIEVEKVPRINSGDEFSKITVYDLPKYVNTDYSILVQYDGFIVNPEQWTDEFLDYDWIGALWTKGHNYFDKNGNQKRWGSRRKVCRYGQKPIEAVKKVVNINLDDWKKDTSQSSSKRTLTHLVSDFKRALPTANERVLMFSDYTSRENKDSIAMFYCSHI